MPTQLGLQRGRCSAGLTRRPERRIVAPRALYHNLGPKPERAKGAQQSLARVLTLVQNRDRQALVDYFATSNLTDTPTLKLGGNEEVMVFEDVMETMLLRSPSQHFLDSYAVRHLILQPPAETQVLSGLLLGADKYVQRMAVTSPLGEHAVLTFTMTSTNPPQQQAQQAEAEAAASLSPALQAQQQSPQPVWRLRGVRGEPGFTCVSPSGPSPELSPEQVVQLQLEALQERNTAAAWRFLSPGSQKILGDEAQFAVNLRKHRRYGAMLGHIAATSVRRCMARPTTYMEIVAVTSASGSRFVFCYILSQEPSGPSPGAGCWSIDFVKVVDDPRLVAAVESSCAARRAQREEE